MKKFNLFIVLLLINFAFLLGCGKNNNSNNRNINNETSKAPKLNNDNSMQVKLNSMSLDEKIGQLLIVGFDGYEANKNIESLIKKNYVGGVILFGNNIRSAEQTMKLTNSLKSINSKNKIPLFISVDEEGGRVSRMPKELEKLPSNKIIGEINNSNLSYNIGKIISKELTCLGFNMNFAPILDINSNLQNPVIGDRSFGNNPNLVTRLGIKTMEGLREGNIIPVIKHFPGHGDTSVDSHVGLPLINHDMKRLKEFELIPFKEAINNNADVVMISHILLPKIDSSYPATMSKIIIKDVLRNDLKFNGVVITDDMTMSAITKNFDISNAAIKSINAGTDIILICHGYDNEIYVINSIKEAVENNIITEDKINESVYRILKLKEKYKISNDTVDNIDVDKINSEIKSIF
ncbi:beta-N-acetylhexosaminidase [Clostridium tetani]|uniref:beta-N-acetylhexosaminidase n=1 Tax=Clostridium tetani (strain Massachusetts / E88) TaxID=212717 RepID=Q892E4_CLOTE|nr:beta-N-acetylhexosaminidase [Clostridium tetani]AAO36651.1 putative anhydromuramoyl-peptide exo-beta-N-acetylglucosaminidase [Clostridium tetani E88]KGI41037.1 glycoside hydrolase family 3 [Clostridium tetani]KGI45784.1 glycoside hydrolase family 3 [Clostridium tetani]KHO31214.1 glycoside hydrolase family 3 [Clostridium tetani]KIG21440.1 glycoside hydrolase family 3 [Clostridium tetani]